MKILTSTKRSAGGRLSREAKALVGRLRDEYSISDQGGLVLLQLVGESFDAMRAAQAAIRRDGLVLVDRFGQTKVHPATVVERDSRAALLHAIRQLGLDVEPSKPKSGGIYGR